MNGVLFFLIYKKTGGRGLKPLHKAVDQGNKDIISGNAKTKRLTINARQARHEGGRGEPQSGPHKQTGSRSCEMCPWQVVLK